MIQWFANVILHTCDPRTIPRASCAPPLTQPYQHRININYKKIIKQLTRSHNFNVVFLDNFFILSSVIHIDTSVFQRFNYIAPNEAKTSKYKLTFLSEMVNWNSLAKAVDTSWTPPLTRLNSDKFTSSMQGQ